MMIPSPTCRWFRALCHSVAAVPAHCAGPQVHLICVCVPLRGRTGGRYDSRTGHVGRIRMDERHHAATTVSAVRRRVIAGCRVGDVGNGALALRAAGTTAAAGFSATHVGGRHLQSIIRAASIGTSEHRQTQRAAVAAVQHMHTRTPLLIRALSAPPARTRLCAFRLAA